MKKSIISAVVLAAMTTGASAQIQKNNADSLGYILGATQGVGLGRDADNNYTGKEATEYKKAFMRGLRDAVLADTVKTGYRDGLAMGQTFLNEFVRMNGVDKPVNVKLFTETFEKFYNGDKISDEQFDELLARMRRQMEPVMQAYKDRQDRAIKEKEERQKATIDNNIAVGRKFMEELKANDKSVVTTPSGLVYKVITEGEGPKVDSNGSAVINYTGTLVDGTQFDSNKGVKMSPAGVIKGFGEGLRLMSKGAHYILYIPYDLAYGMQGPPVIGPAQTLVFDVEVTDVLPAKD